MKFDGRIIHGYATCTVFDGKFTFVLPHEYTVKSNAKIANSSLYKIISEFQWNCNCIRRPHLSDMRLAAKWKLRRAAQLSRGWYA
jgi:hypothetical protein